MDLKIANLATSTLAADIDDDDTSLTIQSADASLFPALGAGEWFPLVITGGGNIEIVKVTARAAATLTIVRGQEGTDGLAWASGSRVDLRFTAAAYSELITEIEARLKKDGSESSPYGTELFVKADYGSVAFTKTGAGTATIKAGTLVEAGGVIHNYSVDTAITMPSLTAGTDYAIWVSPDGTIQATSSFTSPPVTSARKIGGFHYAPGSNAAAQAGGNSTAQINEYSFWDLAWRPACSDPRGMTLVAGSFWADIYFCGVNHHTDGTSKYNVTIADGSSPPKIPTAFGGNGSSTYSTFTWWEAAEVMQSHGKSLMSYDEFAAAAYGTTENTSSGGTDVPTTGANGTGATSNWYVFTSRWGLIQASGCMWTWGDQFVLWPETLAANWYDHNGGRGQINESSENGLHASIFGGSWSNAADSGSRASNWLNVAWSSADAIGARGRSDHVTHV